MADLTQGAGIAGKSFHIGDCFIWSEIAYLDTSTNYREYLPQNSRTSVAMKGGELIMLDDSPQPFDSRIGKIAVIIGSMLFLLAAGCFVDMIVDFF